MCDVITHKHVIWNLYTVGGVRNVVTEGNFSAALE